jgi:hypothetical protein
MAEFARSRWLVDNARKLAPRKGKDSFGEYILA